MFFSRRYYKLSEQIVQVFIPSNLLALHILRTMKHYEVDLISWIITIANRGQKSHQLPPANKIEFVYQ